MIIFIILIAIVVVAIVVAVIVAASSKNNDSEDDDSYNIESEQKPDFSSISLISSNDIAGKWGERLVNMRLRSLLKDGEYLLENILLPLRNGHKTEIDCVLISQKGIFCIETKNWVGHISGNDEDEYWIQKYDDYYRADRKHRNPVLQNENHCGVLEERLNNGYDVINIVIFAELEDWSHIDSNHAFSIDEFARYYRSLSDDEIYVPDLKSIYQKLSIYIATPTELRKHAEDIRKTYINY